MHWETTTKHFVFVIPPSQKETIGKHRSEEQKCQQAQSGHRMAWGLPHCPRKWEPGPCPAQTDRLVFAPLVLALKQWKAQWGSTGPGVTSCFHRALLGEQKHCSGGATWGEQLRHSPLLPTIQNSSYSQKARWDWLRVKKGRELQNWYKEHLVRGKRQGKQTSKSVTEYCCLLDTTFLTRGPFWLLWITLLGAIWNHTLSLKP